MIRPFLMSSGITTPASYVLDHAYSRWTPDAWQSRELLRHGPVGFRTSVSEELPGAPDFLDHVEVHVGDDELVLVLAADGEEVAARVHEIRRAVELADVPGRFGAHAIDAAH